MICPQCNVDSLDPNIVGYAHKPRKARRSVSIERPKEYYRIKAPTQRYRVLPADLISGTEKQCETTRATNKNSPLTLSCGLVHYVDSIS